MVYAIKKKSDGKFTYKDYLTWPENERWELIDGQAFNMTPAPTPRHQTITGNFYSALRARLRDCRIFIAPTDVVLSEYDVVQPDVFVICDVTKITTMNIQGAPDIVIEVLSPTSSLKDKREKRVLYEKFGIKEYIIVYPDDLFIERYCIKDGRYSEPDIIGSQETLTLASIEGIDIPLSEVFET